MADKKETQKQFGTCFENMPFAEMIRKMMGQQGIGSLCAEMMKKIREHQKDGCSFHCVEMIRTMMTECTSTQEKQEVDKDDKA